LSNRFTGRASTAPKPADGTRSAMPIASETLGLF